MTSFRKNSKNINFAIFGFWTFFFRSKNVIIVISSKNATKWCVMWPYFEYDLENAQFHHTFRNFIRTSGSKIGWSPNKYFSNPCKKCFNLRYSLDNLSLFFLFQIMTVRDVKMFLAVSRDLSIDKQNKIYWALKNSTWSDKSHFKKNLDQNSGNGAGFANLDLLSISWPSDSFLWKSNLFSYPFLHEIIKNFIENDFWWTHFKWGWFCVFWIASLMYEYMTSYLWLMLFEFLNRTFKRPSLAFYRKTHNQSSPSVFMVNLVKRWIFNGISL